MQGMIGEVRLFGGNFAPRNWAFCDGQLLAISQNEALFSILGTIYGGDGRTTYALPDLRGRTALGQGNGPGLSPRPLGQRSGTAFNNLNANNLPSHTHTVTTTTQVQIPVSEATQDENSAVGNLLTEVNPNAFYASAGTEDYGSGSTLTGSTVVGQQGASQAMNNQQPFLGIRYIICLTGLFPSRH